MAKEKRANDGELTKEEMLPLDEEAQAALLDENEALKADCEAAQEKLAQAQTELQEEKERYLRLMAEYDNFKRRTAREKQQAYTDAKADALTALLPIIDNLERAVQSGADGAGLRDGVQMTLTQAAEVLKSCGFEEIEALHKPFDPQLLNAVLHVEDESLGEQEICDVLQKGYKIGEKVVRHSMVKVCLLYTSDAADD